MRTLSIDIETYSSENIARVGLYKYVEAFDFEVLLFAYAFDDEPVQCIDLTREKIPPGIIQALQNPYILKKAYNAAFERVCLSTFLNIELPVDQWECTMIRGAMAGLPFGLDAAAKAAGVQITKHADGKKLIAYFSVPCKPTKTNGKRCRNLPVHNQEYWTKFKEYCMGDVEVERALSKQLSAFPIPSMEKELYNLDQRINDAGVQVDLDFCINAIFVDQKIREGLTARAASLTGLDNPNSATQVKRWIESKTGSEITVLNKKAVTEMLEQYDDPEITEVLELRQQLSKTSIKKYQAVADSVCKDNRVRGLFQFYGANRTGRWAGRLVQVHNLPRNYMRNLDGARAIIRTGDPEMAELVLDNIPDTLSQLIRTSFIARPGYQLLVTDFSAIEARVIAWLAGEKWRLDVFNTHGKIYEASAAQMFKVPIESIGKGSDLRQKGKVSELALGYQGGSGALVQMGALNMGLTEKELPELVTKWREANTRIVQLWYDVQKAAIRTVKYGEAQFIQRGIAFRMHNRHLVVKLQSGRYLVYRNPSISDGQFGDQLVYLGVHQDTKQWGRIQTYGGKLVENLVQAIARDCLADAMLRIDQAGFKIVMHVHDEIVVEEPIRGRSVDELNAIMGQPISWATGLPLRGDGFETIYYKKD